MKKRVALPGQVYAHYIEYLEKYGAYQILSVNKEGICYVTLDYLDVVLPEEECLADLKPFYREYFNWNHQIAKSNIDNKPVPKDYILIGECELKSEPSSNSYSGTWPKGIDYITSELWKSFSIEDRNLYKKYRNSGEFVTVQGKQFRKNLISLTDSLYEVMTYNDSLHEFPCIIEAGVQGFSTKLEKILHEKSMLTTLRLFEPKVEVLDLSNTYLTSVVLDVTGVKKVKLPSKLEYLKIHGKISKDLILDDSFCKYKYSVCIDMDSTEFFDCGLSSKKVKSLSVNIFNEINMSQVTNIYPNLKELVIYGRMGIVKNIQDLKKLQNLESLYATEIFGFTVEELEAWESLENLCEMELDSIPKEAGTYLKKYWKGKLDCIKITGLRDKDWVSENLDNPFRHWDGSEFVPAAAYKATMKCYKDIKSSLQNATNRNNIEETVRQYVKCFNKLNDKYDYFIETDEREDIFHVMKQLYEEYVASGVCGKLITLDEIWEVMDGVREDW